MKMDIKPIKTETYYKAVLVEIDQLLEARKDTQAGDRLDILTTLAEAYEKRNYSIEEPDPIEAI